MRERLWGERELEGLLWTRRGKGKRLRQWGLCETLTHGEGEALQNKRLFLFALRTQNFRAKGNVHRSEGGGERGERERGAARGEVVADLLPVRVHIRRELRLRAWEKIR